MNVMCASDYVVIPVEASPWGLFGLANMFEFCNQAKTIALAVQDAFYAVQQAQRE